MNLPDYNTMSQFASSVADGGDRRHTGKTALATFLRGGMPQNGYINGSLEGANKIVYGMEDPTYLAFQFIVNSSAGLFKMPTPNKEDVATMVEYNTHDYSYTALDYLKACQEAESKYYTTTNGNNQATDTQPSANVSSMRRNPKTNIDASITNLTHFVNGFNKICKEYPYYLQSVEGLQEVYKKYFVMAKDAYLGGNDTKVKISCLESMDLRMTALFDAYFRSIYDRKYRRMLIPSNLLQFNCTIIVHDLRRFICSNSNTYKTHITNWSDVEQNTSMIIFRFKDCTFDAEGIGESLSGISNADKNMAKFSFQFSYDDVDIDVCSLADILEPNANKRGRLKEYRDVTDQNVYASSHIDHNTHPITAQDLDYKNVYEDQTGKGLFSTLFNAGRQIMGAATSSSSLGNVYSDGAIGYLDNMFNSIGVGGFGSFLKGEGKQLMREAGNKIFGNVNEDGERTFMGKLTNNGKFNI